MKRILIVEDEADLRESLQDILSMNGYDSIAAENGREGLWLANSSKPDLIISDIMMPEINGFQFLEMLQNNNQLSNIPFIFLSARGEDHNLREGMNLGADDYLTKPVKMNVLLETISRRLLKAENQQRAFESTYKEVLTSINLATQHEFNTPLNSIIGFSQLLLNYPTLPVHKRNYFIKTIAEAGLRLKSTLDNIMLYRAIVAGQIAVKPENFILDNQHLTDWLKPILEKYKRENNLVVLNDLNFNFFCPKDHMHKILTELVDNACKFSDANSQIFVITSKTNNGMMFQIQNSVDNLNSINFGFVDAFKQFDNRKTMTGIGLGLFICKSLADANGWQLELVPDLDRKTFSANIVF